MLIVTQVTLSIMKCFPLSCQMRMEIVVEAATTAHKTHKSDTNVDHTMRWEKEKNDNNNKKRMELKPMEWIKCRRWMNKAPWNSSILLLFLFETVAIPIVWSMATFLLSSLWNKCFEVCGPVFDHDIIIIIMRELLFFCGSSSKWNRNTLALHHQHII